MPLTRQAGFLLEQSSEGPASYWLSGGVTSPVSGHTPFYPCEGLKTSELRAVCDLSAPEWTRERTPGSLLRRSRRKRLRKATYGREGTSRCCPVPGNGANWEQVGLSVLSCKALLSLKKAFTSGKRGRGKVCRKYFSTTVPKCPLPRE